MLISTTEESNQLCSLQFHIEILNGIAAAFAATTQLPAILISD